MEIIGEVAVEIIGMVIVNGGVENPWWIDIIQSIDCFVDVNHFCKEKNGD